MRRTKIVATLGPASDSLEVITQMIAAGVDVFRLNFSHGSTNDHIARAEKVRLAAASLNRYVALLGDLKALRFVLHALIMAQYNWCLDRHLP